MRNDIVTNLLNFDKNILSYVDFNSRLISYELKSTSLGI